MSGGAENRPGEEADCTAEQLPVGKEQLAEFNSLLMRYRAGRSRTEQRIIRSENWWKLRNAAEEEREGTLHGPGFRSTGAWLQNVINNKHADAMDSFPVPIIRPREESDTAQAKILSAIIPCVLEQNGFEEVYSGVMWQKLKTGTGVYRVTWDPSRLSGLGDIAVTRANILNLYWEPGVDDIQKSRCFFDTERVSTEELLRRYPQLEGKADSRGFEPAAFRYDDPEERDGKTTVIGVYYHKDGLLHYCRYCGETVLEATENDPALRKTGLYAHGKYPFVFDALFPIEGSPCGYGYVDICRGPQTEIDLLRTAIVRNALAGATPRVFLRADGSINEQEYLDLSKAVVHVAGNLGEDSLRIIPHTGLDGSYISLLEETINELRETSGNTETSTGSVSGSLTAASAITALQEASGKIARDSTRASYRAYTRLVELCVELIRQFYDLPRQFRITGPMGTQEFVTWSNAAIRPQDQGEEFGVWMGVRVPLFDIRVEAEKKSAYSTLSTNELALQFYRLGMFQPENGTQALACLEMMEFPGRELLVQRLTQNAEAQRRIETAVLAAEGAAV